MKKNILLISMALIAGGTAVAGCSGSDDSGGNPSPVSSVDDQIKAIENNKDMPAPAKQIAIAQIKARSASGMPKPTK